MIKAGALLYAMFLVIVVTIISSSFIFINFYNGEYVISLLKKEQLLKDVESGINYGLVFHQNLPFNQIFNIDLFDDEQHQVILEKKMWGAFYVLKSISQWHKSKLIRTALVGTDFKQSEQTVLYLTDQNKPLSLCGNTKIVGDCYLPESGVKRAYIEGSNFIGNQLINGIKHNSSKTLPELNSEVIDYNKNYSSANDSVISIEVIEEKDSILNSFQNTTLQLYLPSTYCIENKVIQGNVVIKSDQQIIVSSSANISEVVLYAKSVIVEKGFIGDIQIFSEDSIIIEDECHLKYPSVLALLSTENSDNQKIQIGENSKLTGSVFLYKKNFNRNNQGIISIAKGVEIHGQVYSSELMELKGSIYGGAFCQKLLLRTPSSVYENHLLNATIDRSRMSNYFVGVPLTEAPKQQGVIKWLN